MRLIFVFALIYLSVLASAVYSESANLTFKQRVHYQSLIEEVYWQNRIWPKENPTSKPALRQILPDSLIQKKVEDYLQKSNALTSYWNREISSVQLQSEITRMIQNTKQPDLLKKLFNTLNNDPYLIAECLARPLLADRLIRNWYAYDDRFHGELKNKIQFELSHRITIRTLSGNYSEHEYDLSKQEDLDQWKSFQLKFQTQNLTKLNLHENEDSFFVYKVLENSPDRVRVAIVQWPKTSFDVWWKTSRSEVAIGLPQKFHNYYLKDVPQGSCQDDTWRPTLAPPDPRGYHTAIWTGTEMIVWGGTAGVAIFDSGGKYDPATDTWVNITNIGAPTPRYGHTAIWTGSQMIIWGGGMGAGTYTNNGGRYDPLTDTWLPINLTNAPSARTSHTAVWSGSEMIIWGGVDVFLSTDGGRYDPSSDSWTTISETNGPTPRVEHTAVWTGTEMIVWGGLITGGKANTGGKYNPAADAWTATETTNAPDGRNQHTAVWTGTEMIIWGGNSNTFTNTGGKYNPISNSWLPTTTTNAPAARILHTAVWSGSEMIIWGGNVNNTSGQDGARYNPSLDTWAATSTISAPTARQYHSAIWNGSEMIIWGGLGLGGPYVLNDGARYDPALDSWIPTSMLNAPTGRDGHTAIWTGSEMIIWGGGTDIVGYLNTGGRYTPSTDSWTSTNLTTAPEARGIHASVWTGAEMIIWGGSSNSGLLDSGGRYNPATDQWSTTNTFNAPAPRYFHTAVWSGSEMIVWGGHNGIDVINTGGKYNPTTDSWLPTTTTNAPEERRYHTAIWTGTEMIVWGGFNGSTRNTGARYDPVSDNWTATTLMNAPEPRSQHTAVWTGTEMIVWGGFTSINFKSGGRYDPIADSWTQTSTVNAPSGRVNHTAVWTGSEMILWGGVNVDSPAGGRYRPLQDAWQLVSTINQPTPRDAHTAVWTGSEMIVWGGSPRINTGGLYCASETPSCLYCDDFNDGVQPNWTEIKPDCNESGGFMTCSPVRKKAIIIATPAFAGCQNCSVETSVLMTGDPGGRIWLLTHYIDKKNTLEILMKEENDKVVVKQRSNGSIIAKAKADITLDPNNLYSVKVQYDGNIVTVNIGSAPSPQITFTPIGTLPAGSIGFQSKNTNGMFDYITVN